MRVVRHRCSNTDFSCLLIGLTFAIAGCYSESRTSVPARQSQVNPEADSLKTSKTSANAIVIPPIVTATPEDWFEDVTSKTGIEFAYRNGRNAGRFLMIESFGGGVAAVDYDLDGLVDLFVTGGGSISGESPVQIQGLPPALFRNHGHWSFSSTTFWKQYFK